MCEWVQFYVITRNPVHKIRELQGGRGDNAVPQPSLALSQSRSLWGCPTADLGLLPAGNGYQLAVGHQHRHGDRKGSCPPAALVRSPASG